MAAGIEPEHTEGEGGVDGRLGLVLIDTEQGKGGAALARTEGAFEVQRVAEFRDGKSGEMAFEGATQVLLVDGTDKPAGSRWAVILPLHDLEF